MPSPKKTQVIITANAAVAKKVMEELQQRIDAIKTKMKALDVTTKAGQAEFRKLEKELVAYNSAQVENITNTERIRKAMNNLSGTSLKELKRALSAAKSELNKMSANDKGLYKMRDNIKQLESQINKVTGAANKQSSAWSTALRNLTAYVGMFAMFNKAKEMITGAISANLKMSDSLADIRKVSGLVSQDIDKMAVSLSKIDTRTTVEELNRIAYAGAKLGIGEYGVEALEGFVRASNKVNVALKEDLGDEALTALSKITQVMGLIPQMGVEQSMLKTGSAIFKLASTSTATSPKIIDFSNRMLSLGKNAALGTADILALGAAVDSMALEPEVAATAFGKLAVEIRKGTSSMEHDLGIAQGTLKNLVETGRGMDAILMIFQKMKESGNVFALDGLFKDMGSDGARLVKTMVTMADKVDMLGSAVRTANTAFIEGTAITAEYKIQQQTAQGILERAQNMWHKAFVNPEGVSSVKEMAQAWYDFSKYMTQGESTQRSFITSFKILILAVKALIALLPAITAFFVSRGIASAAVWIGSIAKATWAWVTAQKALNVAMSKNVIGVVIALAIELYTWFKRDADAAAEAAKGMEKFDKSLKSVKGDVAKAQVELQRYKEAIDKAKEGTAERQALIDSFNSKFGSYLSNLITEKSTAEDLATAYNEAANAIERKVMAQAKEKDIEKFVAPKAEREAQLLYDFNENAKGSPYNGTWLKSFADDNSKYGINSMISKILKQSGILKSYNAQTNPGLVKALQQTLMNTNGAPADSFDFIFTEKDGSKGTYTHKMTEKEKQVARAIAYLRQRAAREKSTSDVNEKFKDFEDLFLTEEVKGVPVGDGGSDKAEAPEDDARANISEFITKIKNFYERQVAAAMEQMTADGVEKELQDQEVARIEKRMNAALTAAKESLVLGTKAWDEFKDLMDNDLREIGDEYGQSQSTILKSAIQSEDVAQLRADLLKQMPKIKKGKVVGEKSDERDRAYMDRLWLEASKGDTKQAKYEQKVMEQRRKELLERDYTGVVKQNSFMGLVNTGFADVSLADLKTDKDAVISILEKGRTDIAGLFATGGDKDKLLTFLFGEDYEKSIPSQFKQFASLLVSEDEDIRLFYQKLIQYSDEYTEAQKKQYDTTKKIVEQQWAVNQRNLRNQEVQRKMQLRKDAIGKQTSFFSNLGMADVNDPELELMKMKMQAAEEYYAFVQKNSQNQQLLAEADKARQEAEIAYMQKVVASMKDRAAQLGQFLSPVQDFGEAMGEAFAKMSDDADSANEAIKAALKSMISSFGKKLIDDLNTQMWQGINNSIAKRQARKAEAEVAESRATADGNITADLEMERGASAEKPLFVNVVNGEKKSDGAEGSGNIGENGGGTGASATPDASGVNGGSGNGGAATERGNGLARTGARMGSSVGNAIVEGATGGDAGAIGASVVGTALDGLMNADFSTKKSGKSKDEKQEEKARKKALKDERKQAKALAKEKEKGLKDQAKATKKYSKEMTKTTEEGNQEQSKGTQMAQNAIVTAVQTAGTMEIQTKKKNDEQVVKSSGKTAQAETTFSMVGAIAKCFEFLGPIAGPIAAAVVVATLNGLLQWAMSSIFGGSGSDSTASAPTANTKLVSGMLTYDNGNISDLKPFFDKEGNMYWAEEDDSEHKGVSLLTQPTATTINGQPSLVAEQGPELVIGRETTRAMMQNDPQLLRTLYQYDKNHSGRHAFDNGNVSDLEPTVGADGQTIWAESVTASNAALTVAVNALLARLQQPITAKVDMYGRGNLYDSMSKAQQFMKGKF